MNDRPTTQQFPDFLRNGELRLAASYRFDPSHDEDGATVKIPLQALPQVDENLWSWGIPGWRQDLMEALLKALQTQDQCFQISRKFKPNVGRFHINKV